MIPTLKTLKQVKKHIRKEMKISGGIKLQKKNMI